MRKKAVLSRFVLSLEQFNLIFFMRHSINEKSEGREHRCSCSMLISCFYVYDKSASHHETCRVSCDVLATGGVDCGEQYARNTGALGSRPGVLEGTTHGRAHHDKLALTELRLQAKTTLLSPKADGSRNASPILSSARTAC